MATRTTFTGGSGPAGTAYMTNVANHIGVFYNASALRLTGIGGTADAVTAVVDPALDAGLVAGMAFWFTAAATNQNAMTMVVGSEAAVAITDAAGAALAAGAIVSGTTYKLMFDGVRLLRISRTPDVANSGAFIQVDVINTSGSLSKPAGFPADGLVIVEMWGGGGGGSNSSEGGGGGGFNRGLFSGSDLGASETATIGAGGASGAPGGDGGTTSLGSLMSAFGGGGGATNGGHGGGQQTTGPFVGFALGDPGNVGGGGQSGISGGSGGDGIFGGGGGAGDDTSNNARSGGDSLHGGGGGGTNGGAGGVSVFGGDGGASGVAGSIPGGGGGQSAAGARGEIRVRWIG
jgi:hypothetical protein